MNPRKAIRFFGARLHNLKGIDVTIPLRLLTVVTGVSGSGKSTLVHDIIYKSLQARLRQGDGEADAARISKTANLGGEEMPRLSCTRIEGAEAIQDVVMIDQTPIGRTPRSNPITYIKGFDIIRGLFAAIPAAEKRGYTAGHFSFNVPGGRCEVCQGDGTVTVEMQFLADVELVCDECKGTRFKSSILDIKYKGLNVHEVLQLTVREAIGFFHDTGRLVTRLRLLDEVGLGISAAGAIGHDAVGRRGAARQTGGASGAVDEQRHAVHLRRADYRAALRRHQEAAGGVRAADRQRRIAAGDRAQSGRDPGRGLDYRYGSGGRGRRGADRGRGHAGTDRGGGEFSHRPASCAKSCV